MRAIQESFSQSSVGTVPVAIYTRVSTAGQVGGRFDSCESQAAICREHIAKHAPDGWHEVACFTDAAYSGATLNRPGMRFPDWDVPSCPSQRLGPSAGRCIVGSNFANATRRSPANPGVFGSETLLLS